MFYCRPYVVAFCVKMRYVILCIKRSLIDWLIGASYTSVHPTVLQEDATGGCDGRAFPRSPPAVSYSSGTQERQPITILVVNRRATISELCVCVCVCVCECVPWSPVKWV